MALVGRIRRVAGRIVAGDPTVYPQIREFLRTGVDRHVRRAQSKVGARATKFRTAIKADRLRRSGLGLELLMDLDHYRAQVDVELPDKPAAYDHYALTGWTEGLDPHPLFLTRRYVAAAGDLGDMDPVTHYLEVGSAAGISPHPLFDVDYYRTTYPWTTRIDPLVHYIGSGFVERHKPNPFFDTDHYLQLHIDVLGGRDPLSHYVMTGETQGFDPHPLISLHTLRKQLRGQELDEQGRPRTLLERFMDSDRPLNAHPRFNTTYYSRGLVSAGLLDEAEAPLAGPVALTRFLDPDTPRIDPSPGFSEASYAEAYPDIGGMNGLYHYLRYGQREGRTGFSISAKIESAQLAEALAIEPEIVAPHQDMSRATVVDTPRMRDPFVRGVVDLVERIGPVRPDIVVLLRGYVRGGAERYASKLTNGLSRVHPEKSILVLGTDDASEETTSWFEGRDNVHVMSFGTTQFAVDPAVRTRLLSNVLMWLSPDVVVNCNSRTGWTAFQDYGRALKRTSRLMATLFCYDLDPNGRPVGYARDFVRSTIDHVDTYLVDNSAFVDALIADFSLGEHNRERFAVLHQPFEAEPVRETKPAGKSGAQKSGSRKSDSEDSGSGNPGDARRARPRFLWAARFSEQKNPARLRRIAKRMPEADFVVWSTEGWTSGVAGGSRPANVEVVTEQVGLATIVSRGFDGFLMTSDWEGLPTTLIEVTHLGLPIVSSRVGGVTDLIDAESGWLVDVDDRDEDDVVEDFITALNKVAADKNEVARRLEAARKHLKVGFSRQAYSRTLESVFLTGDISRRRLDTAIPEGKRPDMPPLRDTELDVTLVVNAHRERHYLLPTLKACEAALGPCREAGLSVEMVIAADNPDSETLRIAENFAFEHGHRVLRLDVRDLGMARNATVRDARGRYVAFMDGDDLPSRNWVSEAYAFAKQIGTPSVFHPATNYMFGAGQTYIYVHRDMDDPEYNPAALVAENYWTAITMASRQLFLDNPYEPNLLKYGIAYEDWSWNALTHSKGITHKVVPGTSHYIRRKAQGSLLQQTVLSGSLPRLGYLRDVDMSEV